MLATMFVYFTTKKKQRLLTPQQYLQHFLFVSLNKQFPQNMAKCIQAIVLPKNTLNEANILNLLLYNYNTKVRKISASKYEPHDITLDLNHPRNRTFRKEGKVLR